MKTKLFTLAAASLLASTCVLAQPYNDTSNDPGLTNNGDSNAMVQGFNEHEDQDVRSSAQNGMLEAGVSRDGETLGEED